MKIVVIGGVAAGMSAASKIKRDNPEYEVIVLEKGKEVSYGACGLPYYVSDVNPNEDLLRIKKVESFIKGGIDVRLDTTVTDMDTNKKVVYAQNKDTQYELEYDICIIATGASAFVPNVEGSSLDNVFTLKTIEDANKIKSAINENIKDVVIVGGGYIGIEIMESFHHLGKNVVVVERMDNILQSFDVDMALEIEEYIESNGIEIRCSESLMKLNGTTKVESITTDKGEIKADMVILALGVRPNTSFLSNTNIELARNGAVVVDGMMKTNVDNVYACGDCATIFHRVLEKNAYIPLGTNANKQGKLIAKSIKNEEFNLNVAIGSAMIKIIDLECARTGITEAEAIANNIEYGTSKIIGKSHAPYYPNQTDITVKIIYRKSDKVLLGAQLIGKENVAWRMNTLAVCIHNKMNLEEISLLDLGYAPPYSMPWDVIHIAAQSVKE